MLCFEEPDIFQDGQRLYRSLEVGFEDLNIIYF
jgi:hypothetical protein